MDQNMIEGYYDYYYDKYEYTRIGKGKGKKKVRHNVTDIKKFFYGDKICPFCKSRLEKIFVGVEIVTGSPELYYSGDVLECPKCNWWTYKTHFAETDDNLCSINGYYTDTRYYAITKKFDISDKNLPLAVLEKELKERNELLYNIAPYKLEELSQSILKGVYDCEVYHVGKTGDGGTDLIILESDDPILVQVKRRENPEHVELVKGVREFVGTLYIEGKRKGIYISTAKKFSKASKEVAEKLLYNRKLDYFELIDYDKLCSLMKNLGEKKTWEEFTRPFYSNSNARIYDTKESILEFENKKYLMKD